jgi:hypothetical protein
MIRVTKPEKWKDTFFLNLKPIEKLVFIYIYENCDDAGFFDINFSRMTTDIGIDNKTISESLNKLDKTYLTSIDADRIWLKKFLLHQNRLPLDLSSTEGNFIKFQIESNIIKFNNPKDFQDILKNIKKKTTRAKSEFIKPSVEQIVESFRTGEWSFVPEHEIVSIYDYYESVGWKVGRKPMADWKKAFIGCFRRGMSKNKYKQTDYKSAPSKMDMIIKGNEKINGFDFNTLLQKEKP